MTERQHTTEDLFVGQFIPVHYHAIMLADQARMAGFKNALEYASPRRHPPRQTTLRTIDF